MKIAMIGQKIILSRSGGIEVHVLELAKRMVEQGHEVDVICRKSYCEEKTCLQRGVKQKCKYCGINILCVSNIKTKSMDAISYAFFATLKSLFKGYDIIHYHALGPSTMAFIPRLFGKKVVCTVHGLDWQRDKWGKFASAYLKFGEFASARFANRTITVGEKLVGYYKQKYNRDIVYIPNGVVRPMIRNAEIIQTRYGLEKDSYILFLARLVPEKGCHLLIEAFTKSCINMKLVIAGGSSHTDEYEASLHTLGKSDGRIIFTGFITGKILEELYTNAYIYVLPSTIEGLPISLLEALSYGNCCLVSDIEENISVIKDGNNYMGHVFVNKDEYSLIRELEYLVEKSDIVQSYKVKAANYVLNKYEWNKTVEETLRIYKSL
jgi:glycosyltransferase involved in cell wall biosynthesis